MIEDYEEEQIVAHTVSVEALTKKQYREELRSAEKEIEEGNSFKTEELKAEVLKWRK